MTYDEIIEETQRRDAEILRAWADTFGDGPTSEAIRNIVREGADLIHPED